MTRPSTVPLAPCSAYRVLLVLLTISTSPFQYYFSTYSPFIPSKVGTVGTLEKQSVFAVPRQGPSVPPSIPLQCLNRTPFVRFAC